MYHLEDVMSDFSAFHRVDDIEELPASQFFPRARRLISYKGAVRFTAEQEAEKSENKPKMTETTKDWQARRNRNKSASGPEQNGESESVKVDHHYEKIEHNSEIWELGLIESGTG